MSTKKEFTGSICNSDNRKCTGDHMSINGDNCDVYGNYCTINGDNCNVFGNHCVINGDNCRLDGRNGTINGDNCYIAQDANNVVNGCNCTGPGAKAAPRANGSHNFIISNGSCQSMVQNSSGTYINGVRVATGPSSRVVFGANGININGRPLHDVAALARLEAGAAGIVPSARPPAWRAATGHEAAALARLEAHAATLIPRARPSASSPAAAAAPAPVTKKRTPPAPRDEESRKLVKEGQECVVCMDAPRELACIPCGHLCMCEHCAYKLLEEEKANKCPLCNAEITDTNKIFI